MQNVISIISISISTLTIIFVIVNFVLARKDKAVEDTKENNYDLIRYQIQNILEDYKEMSIDIKDIKKMLYDYKSSTYSIVKEQLEEHIKIYHQKEN